jgi:hypothetical protein
LASEAPHVAYRRLPGETARRRRKGEKAFGRGSRSFCRKPYSDPPASRSPENWNNHLPMFDFGAASFSISRGRRCSAGDKGLERFGALVRAELCAEEGGALIVWIGAGDVDVLASGSVTARACGAGAGRAGVEAGAAAVRGRTFVACEGEGCWTARRAGFSAECMASLAWRDVIRVTSAWREVRGPRAYRSGGPPSLRRAWTWPSGGP